MSTTLAFTLAAMASLAPERNHDTLGRAIADRVDAESPMFGADPDKRKTASWLVAISFRESSFKNDITSKTADHCAFQIHLSPGAKTTEGWSAADLRDDAGKCVAVAFRMLRTSLRLCEAHPLAWYAEGPRGCASPRAQRLSADRMWLAKKLAREVAAAGRSASFFWPTRTILPREHACGGLCLAACDRRGAA